MTRLARREPLVSLYRCLIVSQRFVPQLLYKIRSWARAAFSLAFSGCGRFLAFGIASAGALQASFHSLHPAIFRAVPCVVNVKI
jgi:hypothetical protein